MHTNWATKKQILVLNHQYSTSKNSVKMKTPEHLFDIKNLNVCRFLFKIDQNTLKTSRNPYNKDSLAAVH
jgi:hypothetical protein